MRELIGAGVCPVLCFPCVAGRLGALRRVVRFLLVSSRRVRLLFIGSGGLQWSCLHLLLRWGAPTSLRVGSAVNPVCCAGANPWA